MNLAEDSVVFAVAMGRTASAVSPGLSSASTLGPQRVTPLVIAASKAERTKICGITVR